MEHLFQYLHKHPCLDLMETRTNILLNKGKNASFNSVGQTWRNSCVWEHHCQTLVSPSFSYLSLRGTLRPPTGSEHQLLPSVHKPQGHQSPSVQKITQAFLRWEYEDSRNREIRLPRVEVSISVLFTPGYTQLSNLRAIINLFWKCSWLERLG